MTILASDAHPYGLSGFALAVFIVGTCIFAVLFFAAGFGFGRIDREARRANRAEQKTAGGGVHRAPERWGLDPDDVQRIPDLGDVQRHRPKGRRS